MPIQPTGAPVEEEPRREEPAQRGGARRQRQAAATQAAATTTIRQVTRYARQTVDLQPQVIRDAINERASRLDANLLAHAPVFAAELLLGPTPTDRLNRVARATYEGWVEQQAALQAKRQEAVEAEYQDYLETLKPEERAIVEAPAVVQEYYARAADIPDPAQAQHFANWLVFIAQLPPGAKYDRYIDQIPLLYQDALEGNLEEDKSALEQFTGTAGKILAAPIAIPTYLFSRATDVTQVGLGNLEGVPVIGGVAGGASSGLEAVQGTLGAGLHTLETAATFATRNLEALAVGDFNHLDYFTSWSEAEAGGHSPFSMFIADHVLDTTVDDPRYQGLFNAIDLTADTGTAIAMFKALGVLKATRSVTRAGGGVVSGEVFVDTFGKRVVRRVQEVWQESSPGTVRTTLVDRFRNINPDMADAIARAGTVDDIPRIIAEHIDRNPSQALARVSGELDVIRTQARNASAPPVGASPYEFTPRRLGETERPFIETHAPAGEYVYQLTDRSSATRIGSSGVEARPPSRVLTWEDGTTGPRAFWAETGVDTLQLAPDVSNAGILLRTVRGADIRAGTFRGEFYSEVGTRAVEYLRSDGEWRPVSELKTASPVADSVALDALRAQEVALRQRLADLQSYEVDWKFPAKAYIQPFMRGIPADTWAGRMVQRIFGETGTADLSKFTDDVSPNDLNLQRPNSRPGWASHNFEILRKQFNVAKVPKAIQRAVMEEMYGLKTAQDFYLWRLEISKAFEQGLSRGGKRSISPEAQRAIRFADQTIEERMRSPIEVEAVDASGRVAREIRNVLEDPDGNPLPTQPNQFIGDARLPDMQLLQDASSSIRYFDQWAKSKPVIGKVYGALRTPLSVANFVGFTLPRLIIRPLILVTHQAVIAMKIVLDERIRTFLSEETLGVRGKWRKQGIDYTDAGIPVETTTRGHLPPEGGTALGLVANEIGPLTDMVTHKMDTRGIDPNLRPRDAELVARGSYDHIIDLASDQLAKKVALYGADDTLRLLVEHPDTMLGQWYVRDMKPLLERNGITPEQWLRGKDLEITQAAGRDPALREAIGTGRWEVGRDVPTGAAIERQLRLDELDEARTAYHGAEDAVARSELALRVESLEQTIAWLDRHNQTGTILKLADPEKVTGQILDNWREGLYEMPREVMVRRSVYRSSGPPGTRLDRIREASRRVNQKLYQGLRPLGIADFRFARGSMYRRVLGKTYENLKEQGYKPKAAYEIAQQRAAYLTKDLMYDISARSSVDRRLKEYFWFEPVWREQMTTYLYKIPARHYWPAGLFLEYNMAHTLLQGLKNLGVLEEVTSHWVEDGKEMSDSRLVVRLPWVSDFVNKLLNNSDAGSINVEGFNPITPGTAGWFPTVAPTMEHILDLSARKVPDSMKPFFEFTAQWVTFDQDVDEGPSYVPTTVRHLLGMMGMDIPMDTFNLEDWRQMDRKVEIESRQWALSDLAQDGILPPVKATSESEAIQAIYDTQFQRDMKLYEAKVEERASHYEWGLRIIHLIGGVAAPGSVSTGGSTRAEAAWYKFVDGPLAQFEYGTDQYFAAKNDYLAAHPASWPYSVGVHPGGFNEPGYTDRYLEPTGPYDPEEREGGWLTKAIDQTVYWLGDAPDPVAGYAPLEEMSDRWKGKMTVLFAASPLGEVSSYDIHSIRRGDFEVTDEDLAQYNEDQLKAMGIPNFDGREDLIKTLGKIQAEFDRQYDYSLSDEKKALLEGHKDFLMLKAIGPYGAGGVRVLEYVNGTMMERLKTAGYFKSKAISLIVPLAGEIRRAAIAAGFSPQGAAVGDSSFSTLYSKVTLYHRVDLARKADPQFDREMRTIEIGLGEKDGIRGRVAAYETIFFNQPDNFFGYQDAIVQAMRRS